MVSTLCIDFGGTEIKFGMLDGARMLAVDSLPNTGDRSDLGAVASVAFGFGIPVESVSIALPGIVDRTSASLVAAHGKYAWTGGFDFDAWSRATFRVPAVVENDARAAALGETVFGCAAGTRNAVLITLGTGIGAAAVVDGVALRGPHDHAAVLGGHTTVDLDGPDCNCGNVGCAEAIASTWALRRDASDDPALADALRPMKGEPGLRDLIERREHPVVAPVFDRFIRAWSAAIVTMCHAFDPEVVVVAGGAMRAADILLPLLTERVHGHLWSSSFRPPLITPNAPEHSVLLGLSALARRPWKDPS